MSSIVIDKPSKSTWLKPVEQSQNEPNKPWELHLVIPVEGGRFFGRATLRTIPKSGLFSERVKLIIWTMHTSPGDFGFETDVDGMRSPESVEMQVHIFGAPVRLQPMACTGLSSVDETRYEGTWTMPCLDPESCGCDGSDGKFRLSEL
jgi:hypothetical protein